MYIHLTYFINTAHKRTAKRSKPKSPEDQQAQAQQGEQGSQSFENATFPNATMGQGMGYEEGGAQNQTAGGGFQNATFPNATTVGGPGQRQRGRRPAATPATRRMAWPKYVRSENGWRMGDA